MNKIISVFFIALMPAMWTEIARAADTLTGSEIQDLLNGKTVSGTAGKTKHFVKTYNSDGTFTLEVDQKKWGGTWRITADKYCQTQSDKEQCYTVKLSNGSYLMLNDTGEVHTTFTVE